MNSFEKINREQKEKSVKHGCNGVCYSSVSMCPQAETCEETRKGEFIATIVAAVCVLLLPIIAVLGIIFFIMM